MQKEDRDPAILDRTISAVGRYAQERRELVRKAMTHQPGDVAGLAKLRSSVPCGSCTACCRAYNVYLADDDTGEGLDFEVRNGRRILRQHPDGSCIHLVDSKCTVYTHRPSPCRMFDCREMAVSGVAPKNIIGDAVVRWNIFPITFEDHTVRANLTSLARYLTDKGLTPEAAAQAAIMLQPTPEAELSAALAKVVAQHIVAKAEAKL